MNPRRPSLRSGSFIALSLALGMFGASSVGCSSSDEPSSPRADANDGNAIDCTTETRAATYAAGITATNPIGDFVADIVSASPAPPVKGMNTWTLKFTLGGQPYAGPLKVTTFMPDHGHSSSVMPEVTQNADGTYTVTQIYLMMGGLWEVRFASEGTDIHAPASTAEQAVFPFCVQ